MTYAAETALNASIAPWRLNLLRVCYALMAFVMGAIVWQQLLGATPDWALNRGIAKSMLAALALLSIMGVFYPLQMLPLMLFELAWKTIWLGLIAYPAWASGHLTPQMLATFYEVIGVVAFYLVVPWDHVWRAYIRRPAEPFSRRRSEALE